MTFIAYGPAIHDALARKETTTQELVALRDHARTVLRVQGDLDGALRHLDEEIKRREGKG
jgi:hypothetical protein